MPLYGWGCYEQCFEDLNLSFSEHMYVFSSSGYKIQEWSCWVRGIHRFSFEYILLNCYYLNLGIKSPLHFGHFTGMGWAGPEWDTETEWDAVTRPLEWPLLAGTSPEQTRLASVRYQSSGSTQSQGSQEQHVLIIRDFRGHLKLSRSPNSFLSKGFLFTSPPPANQSLELEMMSARHPIS